MLADGRRRFGTLRQYIGVLTGVWKLHWWPCVRCCGDGSIPDPNDPGCDIEGNVRRLNIDCPACKGTGDGTPIQWRRKYEEYKKECGQLEALKAAKLTSLGRLTPEQIEALRLLGV